MCLFVQADKKVLLLLLQRLSPHTSCFASHEVLANLFDSFLTVCLHAAVGPYDVTLVSPRNYFLYTPLLPSAATGTVEPRSIVDPVRSHIPDTV